MKTYTRIVSDRSTCDRNFRQKSPLQQQVRKPLHIQCEPEEEQPATKVGDKDYSEFEWMYLL